jgi:putative transcriptional regulator
MGALAIHAAQWQASAIMNSQLAPSFLVAAPSLLDPNFKRSVVLLVDHGPKGSLGFVVNRPMDVPMGTMLERIGLTGTAQQNADTAAVHSSVLAGGPVGPQTGWVLFERQPSTAADADADVVRVSDRVAVSASRELLESLVTRKGGERMLLVLGYAGWGAGQLDAEISQGAWIPVDFDARIVFDTPYPERWASALRILGIDPARLSVQAPSES